jgi:hypothetical protein
LKGFGYATIEDGCVCLYLKQGVNCAGTVYGGTPWDQVPLEAHLWRKVQEWS